MIGFYIIAPIIAFTITIRIFLSQPKFGKRPNKEAIKRLEKSPQFKNGSFTNTNHTPDLTEGVSYYKVLKEFLIDKKPRKIPEDSLPSKQTDLLHLNPEEDVYVWFGHSSYFIQMDGKKILIDPVFSGNASPLKFTTKSFKGSDVYSVEDIPDLDYLFITHDHWDHLDYKTILQLKSKVKQVICGLGVGEHLKHWGYDPSIIHELDWFDTISVVEGFKVTATPARHFSGRGFKRNTALWVSFVVETKNHKLYLGGDSGYDTHFKTIGEKYGPFDLAILECGQYDKSWKYIHMMPEETVQAGFDLNAKKIIPVHWSKFSLGNHPWDEPIKRYITEAERLNQAFSAPFIGETIHINNTTTYKSNFWESIK
jgi:L-ascorbate metabolism protein UlaG (beta-lactamase superfamily)